MQGGGFGFTSREFGMNCDNVVGVTMMLADGHLVEANATTNADLFWAVRGGTGNNFGVLLEVQYQLHPLGDLLPRVFQILQDLRVAAVAALDPVGVEEDRERRDEPAVGGQHRLDLLVARDRAVLDRARFDGPLVCDRSQAR